MAGGSVMGARHRGAPMTDRLQAGRDALERRCLLDARLEEVANPFLFGEASRLRALLEEAGFRDVRTSRHTLDVEFDEGDTFVALTLMAGAAVVRELESDDDKARTDRCPVAALGHPGVPSSP